MMMILTLKQTLDKHGVWRGVALPNLFDVTSTAAVRDGVDSIFACDVRVQQSDRTPLVFRISQDLHEVANCSEIIFVIHYGQECKGNLGKTRRRSVCAYTSAFFDHIWCFVWF